MRFLSIFTLVSVLLVAMAGPAGAAEVKASDVYLADAQDPAVTTLAKDRGITIAEAQRRIGWQEPAAQLSDELLRSLGEGFGGLWFDRTTGRVKVAVVAAVRAKATSQAQRLVARWRLDDVTDFVAVQHSYAQLERDSAWLGSAISAANAGGGALLGSAMQVSRNRVVLRVPSAAILSSTQQVTVETALAQLGTRVAIESGSGGVQRQRCAWISGDFDCDKPLRGGTRLYRNVSTAWCTTAFNARSNSDGRRYVMTAGHCGPTGTMFHAYQPTTGQFHEVGDVHNSVDAGNDDYAIIRIENVPGWDPRNWVYVHASGDTVLDPDYYINGTATTPEHTRVCLTGSTSGTDCGEVVELNWGGARGLARAEYCSDGGDSGGAVYSGHKARGIHSGVVNGHDDDCLNALFQGINEAASALNVSVVTS